MKMYTLDFDKFFNQVSSITKLDENELSPEQKRYVEIINHIQREDVKVAGDINWGSFTIDELYGAFDYIDGLDDRQSKLSSLMGDVARFKKKKNKMIIDVF